VKKKKNTKVSTVSINICFAAPFFLAATVFESAGAPFAAFVSREKRQSAHARRADKSCALARARTEAARLARNR